MDFDAMKHHRHFNLTLTFAFAMTLALAGCGPKAPTPPNDAQAEAAIQADVDRRMAEVNATIRQQRAGAAQLQGLFAPPPTGPTPPMLNEKEYKLTVHDEAIGKVQKADIAGPGSQVTYWPVKFSAMTPSKRNSGVKGVYNVYRDGFDKWQAQAKELTLIDEGEEHPFSLDN